MDRVLVERVRRFNRTVTQRIGALDDAYLSRGRPLGQARLLWEIAGDTCELRDLRTRLDLDSGYLSRLLTALRADGLVEVGQDGADGRVRTVRLTAAGLAERAELDRLSDELATSILRPLDDDQRERLTSAMAQVERLLVASMVDVTVRDPAEPGARRCVAAYVAELAGRFDGGFDPERSLPAADDELRPPAGLLLVAALHDDPVGCGALKLRADGIAEVKRMWVAPSVRGLCLGRRLLTELERHARAHGVHTLRLETNRALTEAIALYRGAGFREVDAFNDETYAHHWFEKGLP
ncbi:bifunctional helix-turn-helix transcriptional regulator/GNAT family N-acetyltransferase [Amycolatopsis suaedae]|uniref:MarR family transcriptional regulator n=1 Tax=Amycolatopsis suaedae TaxID=2510978 RepID=A0A4Q7J672_9PSEU|nr:helix-turn-helix domain-containing GNAT family N-acetyltransferase [Amycolatopsis suaedae]RZQ63101.1 MarR family transcriptional regulator [Amycolatopsis suaedae]